MEAWDTGIDDDNENDDVGQSLEEPASSDDEPLQQQQQQAEHAASPPEEEQEQEQGRGEEEEEMEATGTSSLMQGDGVPPLAVVGGGTTRADGGKEEEAEAVFESSPTKLAHVLAQARTQQATLLSLTGCLIHEGLVPSQLCELSSLGRLHLAKNQLTALPPLFGLLSNLVELDVSENKLAELPSSFSRLSSLEVLNLGVNELEVIPPEVGDLSGLKVLNLSFNRLSSIPAWPLASLTALVDLDLSANALAALPPALPSNLSTLTSLRLTDNRLDTLPDDFGLHLPLLRRLALARNSLAVLPASFPRLTRLRQLDLRDNRLESLPRDIHLLVKLKVLFLEGNPLRVPVPCLPEATHRSFATNPSAIHAYLSLYRYGEGGNADENDEQRITREDARQSLERMFTNVDPEVISSVLEACEGSVNSAIEFLLSISETPAISAVGARALSTQVDASPLASSATFSFSSLLQAIEEKIDERITGDDANKKPRDRGSGSVFTKVLNTIKTKINENQLDPLSPLRTRDSEDLPTPIPITSELMTRRVRVPSGRLSQSSTNNFLVYEKENNRMLRALCTRPEFRDLLNLLKEKQLTLLVPQDIVLDGVAITRNFLQTHIVQWEDEQSPIFSSLNDITGSLSPDLQSIILSISGEGRKTADILREGQMEFGDLGYDVPLLLISSPLGHVDALDSPALIDSSASSSPSSSSSVTSSLTGFSTSVTPVAHHHLQSDEGHAATGLLESADSGGARCEAGEATSSASGQIDLHLAAPLSLDAFLTKLHDKSTRQLRITIESFARSIQKKKPGPDDKELLFSFLGRTRQAILGHPLWRGISAEEADYTAQALEAVVYTKIYKSVFLSASDQERDRMLMEKMKKLAFVTPDMLGIPPQFCHKRMWAAAEKELLVMNSVCSPTEKLRALLNACRLIIELLKSLDNTAGADDFLPHLCMVVLRAFPPHLHSNVRFIARYTAPEVLAGETLYYYTQLVSVISFVENIDGSHLNIESQDYARLYDGGRDSSILPTHLPRPNHVQSQVAAVPPIFRAQRMGMQAHSQHHRFLAATLEDLRYNDVPQLLAAYKLLAAQWPARTSVDESDQDHNTGAAGGDAGGGGGTLVVKVKYADEQLFRLVSFSPAMGVQGLRTAIAERLQQRRGNEAEEQGLVLAGITLLPDVAIECDADVLLLHTGALLQVTLPSSTA